MQMYEDYEDITTLTEVSERMEYLREHTCPSCGKKGHFMIKYRGDSYLCSVCEYEGSAEDDYNRENYVTDELKKAGYSEQYVGEIYDGYEW